MQKLTVVRLQCKCFSFWGKVNNKSVISRTLAVYCMFARGGGGRGYWPRRCSIFSFLLKRSLWAAAQPRQVGVCFGLQRCNILVWWDWNIFICLKGKCCILRQARTPCKFQLRPLESRDTVEFCAIQLAMLGLLRRVSCPVFSICQVAGLQTSGL